MNFEAEQREFNYKQTNTGSIDKVFPLLCPVREKDWIDGWDYKMIYSMSGLIELGCVFSTPHHGAGETIWYVSKYDTVNYEIEFIRLTPNENVVRIYIQLLSIDNNTTESNITYQYTGLNEQQNEWIRNELELEFSKSMHYWESAINHYLNTGEKLLK